MSIGSLQFLMDIYFVGLSDDVDLISGVGLGNVMMNLIGLQTMYGLNGAIEQLVPQYFGQIHVAKS